MCRRCEQYVALSDARMVSRQWDDDPLLTRGRLYYCPHFLSNPTGEPRGPEVLPGIYSDSFTIELLGADGKHIIDWQTWHYRTSGMLRMLGYAFH